MFEPESITFYMTQKKWLNYEGTENVLKLLIHIHSSAEGLVILSSGIFYSYTCQTKQLGGDATFSVRIKVYVQNTMFSGGLKKEKKAALAAIPTLNSELPQQCLFSCTRCSQSMRLKTYRWCVASWNPR